VNWVPLLWYRTASDVGIFFSFRCWTDRMPDGPAYWLLKQEIHTLCTSTLQANNWNTPYRFTLLVVNGEYNLQLGLVWRNRKKISQIINAYLYLPFFLLIILCFKPSKYALKVDGNDKIQKNFSSQQKNYKNFQKNWEMQKSLGLDLFSCRCLQPEPRI
jgi:hypothetical protein